MSDLQAYISERKKSDPEFAEGMRKGYETLKLVYFYRLREKAGLTQDEVAQHGIKYQKDRRVPY